MTLLPSFPTLCLSVDIGDFTTTTTNWKVSVPAGQSVRISVIDKNGEENWSNPVSHMLIVFEQQLIFLRRPFNPAVTLHALPRAPPVLPLSAQALLNLHRQLLPLVLLTLLVVPPLLATHSPLVIVLRLMGVNSVYPSQPLQAWLPCSPCYKPEHSHPPFRLATLFT